MGDKLLKYDTEEGIYLQCKIYFSATNIIETTDTWIDRHLVKSLKSSAYFTIMADKCQDNYVDSYEELSICCRWVVAYLPTPHGCFP